MFSKEEISLPYHFLNDFSFLQSPRGEFIFSYITANEYKKTSKSFREINLPLIHLTKDYNDKEWSYRDYPENIKNFDDIGELSTFPQEEAEELFSGNYFVSGFNQILDSRGYLVKFVSFINKKNQATLLKIVSQDYGKNWNKIVKISDDFSSWNVCGDPIILKNSIRAGTLLLPVWDNLMRRSSVLISEDYGKTWNQSLFIESEHLNDQSFSSTSENNQSKRIESLKGLKDERIAEWAKVSLIETSDGKVVLSEKRPEYGKNILSFISEDYGYTWRKLGLLSESLGISKSFQMRKFLPNGKQNEQNDKKNSDGKKDLFINPLVGKKDNSYTLLLGFYDKNKGYNKKKSDSQKSKKTKKYYSTLWISPPDTYFEFERVWQASSSININKRDAYCYLYQDFDHCLHIFFTQSKNRVIHYWGDLKWE